MSCAVVARDRLPEACRTLHFAPAERAARGGGGRGPEGWWEGLPAGVGACFHAASDGGWPQSRSQGDALGWGRAARSGLKPDHRLSRWPPPLQVTTTSMRAEGSRSLSPAQRAGFQARIPHIHPSPNGAR